MKQFAICTIGLLIAANAVAAKPGLDEEAQAVVAQRNETRDARMQWWRDAKFGMFVHWGVYSVPADTYKGKQIPGIGEWIMHNAKIPVAEYQEFARQFNPQKFNAEEWVQVREILTRFKPDVIWFDTPLGPVDVNETVKCLALQPDVICNGRLDFTNGNYEVGEDYEVAERSVPSGKVEKDWEACATINDSWGYKSYDTNWKQPERFIQSLIKCAGGGGNYLLNVGPTEEGIIPQGSIDVLKEIGKWLKRNGDSIYGTRGGPFNPIYLTWGSCTAKGNKLYLHVTSPPGHNRIDLSVDPGCEEDLFATKPEQANRLAERALQVFRNE